MERQKDQIMVLQRSSHRVLDLVRRRAAVSSDARDEVDRPKIDLPLDPAGSGRASFSRYAASRRSGVHVPAVGNNGVGKPGIGYPEKLGGQFQRDVAVDSQSPVVHIAGADLGKDVPVLDNEIVVPGPEVD